MLSQKIKTNLFRSLPAIIISIFLIAAIIYAWTEPSSNPPGGNVPAPINVGNSTQYKSGALGIGGILETETALKLVPANINESNLNEEGLIYYDNSSNKFRCYQGTAWVDCIGSGGGSGDSYWAAVKNDKDIIHIYNTNSGNVGIGVPEQYRKMTQSKLVVGGSLVVGSGYVYQKAPDNGIAAQGPLGIGTPQPRGALDVLSGDVYIGQWISKKQLNLNGDARTNWPQYYFYICHKDWFNIYKSCFGYNSATYSIPPLGATCTKGEGKCGSSDFYTNPSSCPQGYYYYEGWCDGDCTGSQDKGTTVCARLP